MAIRVVCPQCGKQLKASDEAAGKRARCLGCQCVLTVPSLPIAAPTALDEYSLADQPAQPRPRPAAHSAAPTSAGAPRLPIEEQNSSPLAARGESLAQTRRPATRPVTPSVTTKSRSRDYLYLVFALAMIPLAWSMFTVNDDLEERIERTFAAHPEALPQEGAEMSVTDLFAQLPGERFEGAHLSHSTWVHWLYALLSAAAFLALIVLAFDRGDERPLSILLVALATATVGILFLITVQYLAQWSQGVWVRGGGIATLIFYLIKLIGFSYHAADDPENGFLLSFMGFTIGIGLCEEFTKALPVIIRGRNGHEFTWRAAVMWGLASGVGFGVAEGIIYSSRYYNGIHAGDIYLIRFVSCVALHAVWSAAVALMIWQNRESFFGSSAWTDFALAVLIVQGVPMILHGLYDTMLKKDMQVWALATAAASFVWLAVLVEYTRRQQDDEPAALGGVSARRPA